MHEGLLRKAAAARVVKLGEARENLTEFVRTVGINAEGNPLEVAPMHLAWHQHVNYCWSHGLHAGIMAHFGSGKSSGFSVPLVTWLLGRNHNLRTIVVSNDDRSAAARVSLMGRIITQLPAYKRIFPQLRKGSKWTDHELVVNRSGYSQDPSVLARGVRSIGVGSHCDVMVFDDPVDQKNSRTEEVRKEIRDLIEQTWLQRIDPGGHALYIATAWHKDDATHQLMTNPAWAFLVQRVSADCTRIEQEVFGNVGDDYPLFGPMSVDA